MRADLAGPEPLTDVHGVTGVIAVLLMLIFAVLATLVLARWDERMTGRHRPTALAPQPSRADDGGDHKQMGHLATRQVSPWHDEPRP